MSNEKQSKGTLWKQDLLQWEKNGGSTIPSENLLWEKLQAKMQSRKKKRYVYILRAAVLLGLLFMGFSLLEKKAPHKDLAFDKPASPAVKNTAKKKSIIPLRVVIPALSNPGSPKTNAIHTKGLLPKKAPHPGVIDEPARSVEIITTITPKELPDTGKQAVSFTHARKKLKVMHLNEWNSPPPPTYATLKDDWIQQQQLSEKQEINTPRYSIWPGKNKNKHPASSGN